MKWWLYIAFKQLFPSGKFASFFALVSIFGVALGILGLYGTQSVMNGFHAQIGKKLRDTTGDIIIRDYGRPMYNLDGLRSKLKSVDGIKSVELMASGPVMMLVRNVPSFPLLRSFDTLSGECAIPIRENNFVKMGDIDMLDDDSIIIGQRLAANLGISVGDKVEVFSPTALDRIKKDEVPMPVRLDVVGFLATDYSEADSSVALVSLRRMRELYNLGEGAHSVILRLEDGLDPTSFSDKIRKDLKAKYYSMAIETSNYAPYVLDEALYALVDLEASEKLEPVIKELANIKENKEAYALGLACTAKIDMHVGNFDSAGMRVEDVTKMMPNLARMYVYSAELLEMRVGLDVAESLCRHAMAIIGRNSPIIAMENVRLLLKKAENSKDSRADNLGAAVKILDKLLLSDPNNLNFLRMRLKLTDEGSPEYKNLEAKIGTLSQSPEKRAYDKLSKPESFSDGDL